ncbi:MAG: hypothetical protein D6706_08295 [Chloroflexi bacterium]|nr:MAG: hypothetical protein D6706_08295 [Chloroflexota bacterium]
MFHLIATLVSIVTRLLLGRPVVIPARYVDALEEEESQDISHEIKVGTYSPTDSVYLYEPNDCDFGWALSGHPIIIKTLRKLEKRHGFYDYSANPKGGAIVTPRRIDNWNCPSLLNDDDLPF